MAEFSSLNGYAVKDTVARNIAKGRNQALAYSNYEAMVDALNTMDNDEFKTGQNIYIGTVGVPDLWVYTVEPVRNTFGYVSDEAIVELLKNNVTIQVGFYKLAMLEVQKVDLTNYDERITANANAITANANAISEQNKNLGGLSFGKDGDGNYGYYGADGSLIPFSKKSHYQMTALETSDTAGNAVIYYYENIDVQNRSAINIRPATAGATEVTARNFVTDGTYTVTRSGNDSYISLKNCTVMSFDIVVRPRGIYVDVEIV